MEILSWSRPEGALSQFPCIWTFCMRQESHRPQSSAICGSAEKRAEIGG